MHEPTQTYVTFHNPKINVSNILVTTRHPWVSINMIKAARSLGPLAIEALYKEIIDDFVELAHVPLLRVEQYSKYSKLPVGIANYYSYIYNTLQK